MTTIIINKRTKSGKLLFEMAKLLSEINKDVIITEREKPRYNKETEQAIKEAKLGKTTQISIEDFRKQLYS